MGVHRLSKDKDGRFRCPACNDPLRYHSGDAVRIENGKVNMECTKPRWICDHCHIFYREIVVASGCYESFKLEDEPEDPPKQMDTAEEPVAKKAIASAAPAQPPSSSQSLQDIPGQHLVPVGELQSMKLVKDADGFCTCPRCKGEMYFIEGQPVRIVDGKPDMENVWGHFFCPHCGSIFRRVAGTEYYQWCEK